MKRLFSIRASFALGITILIIIGCGGGNVADSDLALTTRDMVDNFAGELKSELYSAIQDSGVVWAVRICSERAPEISAGYSSIPGWSISRVSERYRNPVNAPDDFELEALKTLAARPANAGDEFYQWTEEDGQKSFRYVKAIKFKQTCRNCHGDKEEFSEELRAIIDEKYPDDMAHGYSLDEIRGIFSVKVDWPEGRAAFDSMMTAM
ncbi:MAG: DUF3365 domain-containing protein [candidate division Zixibacteria bacterium]